MKKPSDRFEWGLDDIEIETPAKKPPEPPQKRTNDRPAALPLITVNGRVVAYYPTPPRK